MDEKQLDLNAPLLSVRRLTSTSSNFHPIHPKFTENSRPTRQQSLPLPKPNWEAEEVVTKPATVPFLWEQIPGRAKEKKNFPLEKPSNSPILEMIKKISVEKVEEREEMESEGEDEHNAYCDAPEMLSPTDMGSSRSFNIDPKTRDYMMSRFLPAAMAMALDTPQFVPKKQNVPNEVPKYEKKVYSGELRPLLEQYMSHNLSPYYEMKVSLRCNYEDDGNEDGKKRLGKACGILPQFSMKSYLGLFNPVPGIKLKTQSQTQTKNEIRTRTRAQTPLRYSGEIRRAAKISYSGPLTTLEKQTLDAVYRRKSESKSRELRGAENKLSGKLDHFCQSNDSFLSDGMSPYRNSQRGRISPYRNETPRSPFHDGATFLGLPKEIHNANPVQDHSTHQKHFTSPDYVAEKTLYVDSVNKIETRSNSASSKSETIEESRRVEVSSACTFTATDKKHGSSANRWSSGQKPKTIQLCNQGSDTEVDAFQWTGSNLQKPKPVGSCNQGSDMNVEALEWSGTNLRKPKTIGSYNQGSDYEVVAFESSGTSRQKPNSVGLYNQGFHKEVEAFACSKSNGVVKEDGRGNAILGTPKSHFPLPLPKSPSESWLRHTISLGNPFPKKQGQKNSSTDAKWETIVKASHIHHDRIRYSSEELLTHVSHHSKN